MASIDSLILDLSADLAPVTRRSLWREAGAVLALVLAELSLVVASGFLRPDMGRIVFSSFMAWKTGSLALLAAASGAVAVRSFAPPSSPQHGLKLTLHVAVCAILCGMLVSAPADHARSLIERLSPAHGVRCAVLITVLSLPVLMLLAVLMRRAAPVQPKRSAVATGLAAASCGALIFTACCPMNDPLYIIVWYSTGILTVMALARMLLPRRLLL